MCGMVPKMWDMVPKMCEQDETGRNGKKPKETGWYWKKQEETGKNKKKPEETLRKRKKH